jgi:predicted lipase
VNITGHSLGGAIAVILMTHLQADEYTIGSVITFGQPKVTNEAGVQHIDDSPVLRIIHHDDLVPLVPPLSLLSAIHGTYRHMGPEIILLPDENFMALLI